jgi:hypothetical protein
MPSDSGLISDVVAVQHNTGIAAPQQFLWICTQANNRGSGKSLNPFSSEKGFQEKVLRDK